MTVNIGLIGAGRVAVIHAEALASQPGVKIVAVTDPRPGAAKSLAAHFGAPSCEDLSTLLAFPGLDAVDIMVPHNLHVSIAERALGAKKHVFMDKPLATNLADADRLVVVAKRSGRVFMVCHNLLFHPAVIRAGELVRSGAFGALRLGDAWSHGWLDLAPWDFRQSREATGGGAWIDNGPHLIYTLEALAGRMTDVTAVASTGPSRLEGEDSAAGVSRFECGACGTVRVSYAIRSEITREPWPAGWRMGFRIDGTDGYLQLDLLPATRLHWYNGEGARNEEFGTTTFTDSFGGALREFISAVVDHREPSVGVAEARRCLQLTLGALEPSP